MKKIPARKRSFRSQDANYVSALKSRLTADWTTTPRPANGVIRQDLKSLVARSRDLVRNNATASRYVSVSRANINGNKGIMLQMKVRDLNGSLDTVAGSKIEDAWNKWTKRENCTMSGDMTFKEVQDSVVASWVTDGECFVRRFINADNPFRFAIQIIDAMRLDVDLNRPRTRGQNAIKMGIECDEDGRLVAYYFTMGNQDDYVYRDGTYQYRGEHLRVPAEEIYHIYRRDFAGQSRGVPLLTPAMQNLKMLDGYIEAELVASRVSASKMGFYQTPTGNEFAGADAGGGNVYDEVEPGVIGELPAGTTFEAFDPQHPTSAFSDFVKGQLKQIASALNVSYPTLASDLEGVNYSSIRAGVLEDREQWKMAQQMIIDQFLHPLFTDWLFNALVTKMVDLPLERIEKFKADTWQARRWQWVDPKKDIEASLLALNNQLTSRSMITAEVGNDFEDVLQSIKRDDDMAKRFGVQLSAPDKPQEGNDDGE